MFMWRRIFIELQNILFCIAKYSQFLYTEDIDVNMLFADQIYLFVILCWLTLLASK